MAAAELEKVTAIEKLSKQAVQEYEGLQKKLETATMECKRLEEERDEALEKLSEFHHVSQMVIEEVSSIQENLEIERTCRASAESLASKLNSQNRSLKRKSMMLLSHLSPDAIADINFEEEEKGEGGDLCLSPQCHTTISELREQLASAVKEKNQAVTTLEAVQDQLRKNRDQLLEEKHSNMLLMAETLQQKKLLGKYNRVSQFAVEEYETMQDTLDLERNLRMEAENFARAMVVEQKELKRQSVILMQSSSPSQALQEALSQVTRLTRELETQKLEHSDQMKQVEEGLRSCETQREMTALRRQLQLMEEEKREFSERCSKAETQVKDLHYTVEELQQKLQAATNPPPSAAPPPPPPPPLPPVAAMASNPLSSLLSLIRKRRDCTAIPLVVQDAKMPESDVRQQAVEEMMQRIKRGVQLRPVAQSPSAARRQVQRLPSNSAIQELKGIMVNLSPNSTRRKAACPTRRRDEELHRVLLKRRVALEAP